MEKRLFLALFLVSIVFIAGCAETGQKVTKEEILAKIEKANYCDAASDCRTFNFGCPTGCHKLINKNSNTEEIKKLVDAYNQADKLCSLMEYTCELPPEQDKIKCINKKCVAEEKPVVLECSTDSDCGIGGCSGQVCTTKDRAKDIITTCEYLPVYGCYKQTTCSCINSKCEWKENEQFLRCKEGAEKAGNGGMIV